MADSAVLVRTCREEDIPVLAGMMRDIWHDTAGYRKVEEWYGVTVGGRHWWEHKSDDLEDLFVRKPEWVVVAEVDGAAVGYATLNVDDEGLGWVGENGVHPDYRRRGIGKQLHEEVLRRLKATGATLVFAMTTLENSGARAVYESHGFQPIHTSVMLVNKL